MASLNKTYLMGNLTADPTDEQTVKGTAISRFSLAINTYVKNAQGGRSPATTYINVQSYGKTAELCRQFLHKGDPVFVEGRICQDSWQDKQTGNPRSKTYVMAENVQFIAARKQETADRPQQQQPRQQQRPNPQQEADSDIPF